MLSEEVELFRFRVRVERVRLAVTRGDKEFPMREVKGLAQIMRENLQQLKMVAAKATTEFHAEVSRAQTNIEKVQSMTQELKAGNKEVEEVLHGSGSNFPGQDEQQQDGPKLGLVGGAPQVEELTSDPAVKADRNGVKLNPDRPQKPEGSPDVNGVTKSNKAP